MRKAGKVTFRYSFITVSELMQKNIESTGYAQARAKVLHDLCGSHTLVFLDDLMYQDCIHTLGKSRKAYPCYAWDDEGRYYPSNIDLGTDFKSRAAKQLSEQFGKMKNTIQNPVKRKELKRIGKQLIRNGNLTSQALEIVKGGEAVFTEEYPHLKPAELSLIFQQCLKGEITQATFSRRLASIFFDPVSMTACPKEEVQKLIEAFQWLKRSAPKLINIMAGGREIFANHETARKAENSRLKSKAIYNELGMDLSDVRGKWLSNCWAACKEDLRARDITHKKFLALVQDPLAKIPSVDAFTSIAEAYIQQMMLQKRTLLDSDVGDLAQSVYLPYVDIFRTDKTMSNFFEPIAARYATTVFSTLGQLMDVLDSVVPGQDER
jgi:hypothetical protein